MTIDQARAICRHLVIAHQSLLTCEQAAALRQRLVDLRDSLNPDGLQYQGDVPAAYQECKEIYAVLEQLKGVRPATALVAQKMPDSNPPTLLQGVADALTQLTKAGALLADLMKATPGNISI